MATGTWTTREARERAAFVLGVDPTASTAEARSSYRRQLRALAGESEHERTARRTLMAAWAVWHDTVPELRVLPAVGDETDDGHRDDVHLIDLARAERERRLAEQEPSGRHGGRPALDDLVELPAHDRAEVLVEQRVDASAEDRIEVLEVVREHGGRAVSPVAVRHTDRDVDPDADRSATRERPGRDRPEPRPPGLGVLRPVVGGAGFVVDDARAHRAYARSEQRRPGSDVSVVL